jgi:hypothetical protein
MIVSVTYFDRSATQKTGPINPSPFQPGIIGQRFSKDCFDHPSSRLPEDVSVVGFVDEMAREFSEMVAEVRARVALTTGVDI